MCWSRVVSLLAAVVLAEGRVCVPIHECTAIAARILQHGEGRLCKLADNSAGIVCQSSARRLNSITWSINGLNDDEGEVKMYIPENGDNTRYKYQLLPERERPVEFLFDGDQVEEAIQIAHKNLLATSRQKQLRMQQTQEPDNFHEQLLKQLRFFPQETNVSRKESAETRFHIEVLKVLKEHDAIYPKGTTEHRRARRSTRFLKLIPKCTPKPPVRCDNPNAQWWRNDNGQCTNLDHPRLGAVQTAQKRLLPSRYEDDIWEPLRKNRWNDWLPWPRVVSTTIIDTTPRDDAQHTTSLMLFGQFIAHDVVTTPTRRPGGLRNCCLNNHRFPPFKLHKDCYPIRIPADDPLYAHVNVNCLNHFRSRPADFEDCELRPVSPINQATHYLDASTVYGSDSATAGQLREQVGGRLRMGNDGLLPMRDGVFMTGEGRSDVVPLLTFMHTVWAREHNRIAEAVEKHNPQWNDLRLYLMARRIMVAEYQHIVYNEYLPTILGQKYMDDHGLSVDIEHNVLKYSGQVDPRVSVEFSTAAFRFGHSQVPDTYDLYSQDGKLEKKIFTAEYYFDEQLLKEAGMFERLARSTVYQKPRSVGSSYSSVLHQQLFAAAHKNKGFDLISNNLNRGRDHGLPGYVDMLEACTGRSFMSWPSLHEFFDHSTLLKLKRVYSDIRDIELYIGGVIEKKKPGALVGEVFQCIIGEQFFSLYYGDRFFYLHGNMTSSFTEDQLKEIKKASWARVLCDNVANFTRVQPLALWQADGKSNPRQDCSSEAIPRMNLTVFKF